MGAHASPEPQAPVTPATAAPATPQPAAHVHDVEQNPILLAFALNHVREAAFLHDDDGRFELVNDEACRSLRYSRDELLGMTVEDVDPSWDEPRGREAIEAIRRGGSFSFESRHRRRDGVLIPVEVTATRFEHAGRGHVLALARDLRERQAAEATIRRLNADLEATLQAIPDLLFEFDQEGAYLRVQAPRPELLAIPADQLVGRTLADTMPPDALAVGLEVIREADEHGISRGHVYALDLPDGRHWFEVACSRKADADGSGPHFIAVIRDITARVVATEALRERERELDESRERYRVVLDSVRDQLFLLQVADGAQLRILEVNDAFATAFGRPRDAVIGRPPAEVVPEALAARLDEACRRVVAEGATVEERLDAELASGPRILEMALVPVRGPDGRVARIVGRSHDVTERELAERAREASEANYRTLMEQASDAIFVAGAERRYTDVNIAACELLGYTRDELLAMRIEDVTPSELNPGQADRLRRLDAGEILVSERVMRRKDGSLITAELSVRQLPDGRLQAIGRDITERKRIQQEQARLVAAVEQAAESIVITDPATVIQYVNPAFERASGYERAEVMGRTPRLLSSGQHGAAFYRAMWDRLLAGETWQGTLVNRRKDGTLYEEDASIRPIYDESGQLAAYVGVKRDVTRERTLEAEIRQMHKMEAIGQLAGGIAHDFNNLITAIRGYAEIARDTLPAGVPQREDLAEVLAAADRAADLTRQLLAFSRRLPLTPAVLSASEVVTRIAPMLRRLLGEHIDLVCRADATGLVRADRSQLEQVLVNLAVNARDAMADGGRLTIATADEDGGDGAGAAAEEGSVAIRVADTGTGMTDETLARAFEPFFTTKPTGKGTGLGLSMVYGTVTASGGRIDVDSRVGGGTTFTIHLPRVDGEVAAPAPHTDSDALRGVETILLVEDEARVRGFARRVLEGWGYRVIEASNGAEGEAQARATGDSVDLLVSDLVMPQLGGLALLARLRESRPDLRAVLVSGFSDADRVALARDPLTVFLPKPFNGHELGRAVRTALDAPPGEDAPAPSPGDQSRS